MGYPTFDPRFFGTAYPMPEAIKRLPVDLLRKSLVTRDPEASARAMQDFRQGMQATEFVHTANLPQRMLFQQHKSEERGGTSRPDHRAARSSAEGYSAAIRPPAVAKAADLDRASGLRGFGDVSSVASVSLRRPERVPTYTESAAARARGSDALPVPELRTSVPGMGVRVRPVHQPSAPSPQAFGDQLADAQAQSAARTAFAKTNAMQAAQLARMAILKRAGLIR